MEILTAVVVSKDDDHNSLSVVAYTNVGETAKIDAIVSPILTPDVGDNVVIIRQDETREWTVVGVGYCNGIFY